MVVVCVCFLPEALGLDDSGRFFFLFVMVEGGGEKVCCVCSKVRIGEGVWMYEGCMRGG